MSETSHPLLPAAVPLLRDGRDAVQVGGVDSSDGVLLGPDGARLAALLRTLDGRRARRAVLADAAAQGLDPASIARVLDGLRSAELLVDLDPADLLAADAGPAAAARTGAELHSALGRVPGAWRARRSAVVVVEGATRVGVPLAAVLAASGVGRVSVADSGLTAAADAVVGGLSADDEGRPRSLAAADAVRRASPLTDLRPPPPGAAADLVVLARPWAASDPLVAGIHRAGVPHLVATVRGETGVVGPFVVPGRTSCLRCADLHRRDADPRWPRLAAQLTATEAPPSGATVTCLMTAAIAALQVLAFLDGSSAPSTLDATVELAPPHLLPRARSWLAHRGCDCGAAARTDRPTWTATRPGDATAPPAGADEARQGTMGG
ncbi:ThiF family adenylyltransferase [Blastococcus sp. PRF04-17]|uniref:ThiF family adenylyltransferase n=1 Tax=Blastococcus sp. PRF04-17 TaxID=2933797 RepID=UPI001FF3D8BE|nr:ThiF family adenylyltransferase [Blastococcus sp. PRF04-17]UOY01313.1 ThiF family adenylyltransferase [Blastococcus sp. PRF04-17]